MMGKTKCPPVYTHVSVDTYILTTFVSMDTIFYRTSWCACLGFVCVCVCVVCTTKVWKNHKEMCRKFCSVLQYNMPMIYSWNMFCKEQHIFLPIFFHTIHYIRYIYCEIRCFPDFFSIINIECVWWIINMCRYTCFKRGKSRKKG